MFPLFLHREKRLGVSRRHRFLHLRQGLPQFPAGVSDQGLERALVDHGDDAALNSATQQFACQALPCGIVQAGFPALLLGIDVGKQIRQRLEFDEAVKGESDGTAVLQDRGRGRDQGLKRNLLRLQGQGQGREYQENVWGGRPRPPPF